MTKEVITIDQLRYQRMITEKLDETESRWKNRFSWYPGGQAEYYGRIPQIYSESRETYGDKLFFEYARRNRLHERFTFDEREERIKEKKRRTMVGEEQTDLKASLTTNGEYGRVKPNRMHFYCN
ncbi:uncharacterized protein LOC115634228 [Scaptodrosophila lebanonensis]|uniref:Uncharacterized protein LOC115634228 n=1 Tax=Drosophila lebanonensis TaxID=7225 RepID=A0A6J2UH08_DROLE|nr:uncharacterized protein LOC115634228 [Scaptodrosophila lebanonensis]